MPRLRGTAPSGASATNAQKPALGPNPSRSQSAAAARTACAEFSPSAKSSLNRINAGTSAGVAARTRKPSAVRSTQTASAMLAGGLDNEVDFACDAEAAMEASMSGYG